MRILLACCSLLFLLACEESTRDKDKGAIQITVARDTAEKSNVEETIEHNPLPKAISPTKNSQLINYQEIEWTELIPKTDLDALLNPPDYIMDVEDGSIEDQLVRKIPSVMSTEQGAENNYEKALISTKIIEAMDGKNIEIPGFIVPVEFNDEQVVTSFFLVPYFGACLHMPAPPPNQIIYVEIKQGFVLETLYDPVVVSGTLSVALFEDQIATSAYTMKIDKIRMYYEN